MSEPQVAGAKPFPPIWPQPIPIIGVTGKKWSGKTKFLLNICPGNRTTLVYDWEQSSASYEQEYARIGAPFDRIDVQKEMLNYQDDKGNFPFRANSYKPIDVFLWWRKHVLSIPAGKYQVIAVDPVTDLERGLTDWVAANPKFFGHTEGQYARASGIMWGDVKDYEKQLLADITAKCQTFGFTAHIGTEFKGGSPTGKEKAKGKETLYELATLYLWLDRDPDKNGARPNVPAAKVEKSRLEVAELKDGEVVSYSVLPPRIPHCTPKAIREYFKKPAGRGELSDAERAKEEVMSADDRLRLEVLKAEADRDAAQARAVATAVTVATPPVVIGTKAAEFEKTIRGATATAYLIETVGPAIKVASDAGEVSAAEVDYLRTVFNECGRRLKAQESQTAA